MTSFPPIFRMPAFAWACAALAGGCLAAAALWAARRPLYRLADGFRAMPPLRRALAALAVAAAVAYAGTKPEATDGLSTNRHESARIEEGAGGEGVSSKEQAVSAEDSSSVVAVGGTQQDVDHDTYSLLDRDISRGYRLVSVATNGAHSYEMPPDARLIGTWHLTDAYDAVARVFLEGVRRKEEEAGGEGESSKEQVVSAEFSSSVVAAGGTQLDVAHHTYSLHLPPYSLSHHSLSHSPFSFPLGGQVVTSLWAHVWGRARPQLGNVSNELVAVGAPMFARRGVSRLWTAATPSNTVLLTWQDFFFKGVSSKEKVVSADGSSEEEVVRSKEQVVSAESSSSVVAAGGTQQGVDHHTCSLLPTPCSLLPTPYSLITSPSSLISAQLELFRDGSFVARSNSVARVYRRVNPDDWDGDGIPNAEDDDPRVAADEPRFGPRQSLPPGAHTNNYFWIDLAVRDADTLVSFAGDAPSNLPDPSFVAKAGETNRVTLLVGKAYTVRSLLPVEVVGKSSDAVEVRQEADGTLRLLWPVAIGVREEGASSKEKGAGDEGVSSKEQVVSAEFSSSSVAVGGTEKDGNDHTYSSLLPPYSLSAVAACGTQQDVAHHTYSLLLAPYSLSHRSLLLPPYSLNATPSSFTMALSPLWLVGAFAWTNACCRVAGDGLAFSFACGGECACGGCAATGYFAYEGYRLPARGGACPCGGSGGAVVPGDEGDEEPDPLPGASARFSKRVILFEDEYEDAPGVTVPWRSTETELDCRASGGPNGGRVRIEARGIDGLMPYGGLPLPFERELGPFEEVAFRNTYRAVRPSGGEGDIVVTATFEENGTGAAWTSEDRATAVRLKFEPVAPAPANKSTGRHKYGIGEEVGCTQSPNAPKVRWSLKAGEMDEDASQYKCPMYAVHEPLAATCGDAEFTPAVSVVPPQTVSARDPGWDDFDAPIGEAGSVVMLLPLYIGPMDVSFANISVEEVPYEDHPNGNDAQSGYFARRDLALWWHHTRDNGAGVWRNVDAKTHRMGGDSAYDQAGVTETLPRVNSSGLFVDDPNCGWAYGRIVMETPFGWNKKNTQGEARPYKMFAGSVWAILELQENGTFRVEKLGNTIIRHVGGEVFLNGVRKK